MTMDPIAPFALRTPASLAEASALLAGRGARALAGGTDLIPNLRHGLGAPTQLVDVAGLPELSSMSFASGAATIGAGVTLARLASDAGIRRELPALADAARLVAGPAHRSVATLGGNLCQDTRCVFYNQSAWWRGANDHCLKYGGDTCHVAPQGARCHAAFASDLAPVLLVLGASVTVAGAQGTRTTPLADLYVDDGAAHLSLREGELVLSVTIPRPAAGARIGYRKHRARGAIDFPLAGVAVRIAMDAALIVDTAVAITGTNPRPLLLEGTAALIGRPLDDAALAALAKLVRQQARPMRTTVTHANHRREVAAVLVQRLARELAAQGAAARR
jgi:4-hydroxybenzoyl-CoA reductase subunit beta